ncbi:Ig-like domain repeat protein [Methanobrevibacter sp.]|uniref:Ig-like domain repeat protein n=1 Tax=Methanobrevibacter sp. TaxID=66852 RepID=UPI00386B38E1
MKYKKGLVFICLIICLFSIASVYASDVNETDISSENQITIDETDDILAIEEQYGGEVGATEDNELSATTGTFTDLANDIANADGELNLTQNYVYDPSKDSRYKNGIDINKQILINGKGFVINGKEQASAFNVAQSGVTLKNIKFKNCNCSSTGGAIVWNGANGNILYCSFVNCHTPLSGGAVYWTGIDGNLIDCDFVDCYSNNGGAVYWDGNNGNILDSDFENCYCYSYANITVSSSTSSRSTGGAIYWNGNNGKLINSNFKNCYSSNNVYISFSTTNTGTVSSSSNSFGGAVSWYGDNGNMTNCNFENSHVSSSSYCNSYGYSTASNTNSYSNCYGGSVFWNGNDGNMVNCNFKTSYGTSDSYGYSYKRIGSSYSYSYGGSIYWMGNDGNIIDCNFESSHIISSSYGSSDGTKSSYAYGGTIYWYGDEGNLFNCNFKDYYASASTTNSGGAIYWYGDEGNMFNCSFNGSYYNYREVCKSEKNVYPVLLIHNSSIYNNDDYIIICDVTPLVNNISVSIYNVTDKISLYKQFSMSSEELTSSFTVNNLEEGEYQLVLDYSGDSFYTGTSANNLFKVGKNSSQEVTIFGGVVEGDNVIINVTLNEDATGRVRITLANYTFINELADGKTCFDIPYVNGGINTYKIKYEGDDKYNPIYITNTFKILYKSNITLNLKQNTSFDENIPVIYTITPNCEGIISVFVDNIFKANITVGDIFELENITVGSHNVTVIYSGDDSYSSCYDTATITVLKAKPTIEINSSELAGDVLFDVILNKKTTGNITITINNNSYSAKLIEGKTNITIHNLTAGNHSCTIIYEGDSNYVSLTHDYNFTLQFKKSEITVYVSDKTIGETIDVQFDLTANATGSISVYINNTFIKNVALGEEVNIYDLPVGNYLVKLVYSGDNYYSSCENTATFKVLKIKPTIDMLTLNSTSDNITFGEAADINYHITDGVTGNISVYIDSVLNKTININDSLSINGLNAGYHTIKLVYNGNANYSSCENNITFEVLKKKIDITDSINLIDMIYGKSQISFDSSLSGVLNINASNKYFKSFNVNANINYLNLSGINVGDYDVEYVFIPINQNYDKATTRSTLTIFKGEPTFDIVIDDVNYNESTNLTINYLNDITGIANVTISNNAGFEIKFSNVTLSGGKFSRILSNLNASEYKITVNYGGNNNYYSTTQNKTFNVFKIDPVIAVEVTNAEYGQTAKIVVNCNAEGNITITIVSVRTYDDLIIRNQRVVQNINDIDAGTYDVKVKYNGNDNYNTKTADAILTITKVSTNVVASVDDITYSEYLVINVKGSVDGVATVKIDNNYVKEVNVIANTVVPVTFYDKILAGKHNVSVILHPSDKNYGNSFFNTNFTVAKKQTSITLGAKDSVYGEDVIVNVTASADGKVVITVGDITREKDVLANTLTKINLGVLAADSYDVEVSFDAGENYKPSNNNGNIVISPAKAEIVTIEAPNNVYGENTIIKVKTNVGGNLTVKAGSAIKSVNVVANKLTSFDFGILDAKTYDIEVSLNAGNNYTKPLNKTQITVSPKQTTVNVNVKNSIYGENVIVNVTASENGKITVQVGTIIKDVNVEANKLYSVDFGILDAKSYAVNATFNGGNNYEKSFDDTSLVISPAQSKITEIQALDKIYGENVIVNVKTNVDGSLTAKIGNITKVIDVTANQIMSINFGVLDVNSYDITLNLNAGSNYVSDNNSTKISVSPKQTDLTLIVKEYESTENVIVNVTATENGKVTIKCNNIVKTADVTANNVASFDFGVLPIGSYEVIANFTAGNNYIDSSASTTFKVLLKINDDDLSISVPDIKAGQANNIAIRLPGDATGTVNLTIGKDTYTFDVINGVANVKVPELTEGNYNFTITYSGDNKYSSFSRTNSISVTKIIPTTVTSSAITTAYNGGKYLVATLKDINGKPIVGVQVTINLNGVKYLTTDKNGQVKLSTNGLAPNTYTATITFAGNTNYAKSTTTAKVTVKKATPKLTANKKTFKKSVKTKKYTVTLKDNQNKAMKNIKVTIKVNKKTYTAKTNAKGKATFKIKKLTKKGKYNVAVTYKGNKYYNKVTKKAKIIVK